MHFNPSSEQVTMPPEPPSKRINTNAWRHYEPAANGGFASELTVLMRPDAVAQQDQRGTHPDLNRDLKRV